MDMSPANSIDDTVLELFGPGSQGTKEEIEGSNLSRGGPNSSCNCNPNRCAGENGCLCFVTETDYAWFVPSLDDGSCPAGSLSVSTDYLEVFDMLASCRARAAARAGWDK